MSPSWAKLASGSELDVILRHLRTKMEAKFDLEAVLKRSGVVLRRSWAVLGRSWGNLEGSEAIWGAQVSEEGGGAAEHAWPPPRDFLRKYLRDLGT